MVNVDTMIHEIMKPKFNMIQLKEYKKYENKKFLILKNNNSIVVVDNRSQPPQIHSNICNAFRKIKGKEKEP